LNRPVKGDLRQLLFSWSPRYTVSAEYAARVLDVSVPTVCRMIAGNELEAEKMNPTKTNSPWRVNYDSVVKIAEKIYQQSGVERRF